MARATGFYHDTATGDIKMNRGDTGSFWVHASRSNGEEWPAESRMLFTIRNQQKETVMQRFYRLDDQWGRGNGWVLIEFHNNDTDSWENGTYEMERRYNVSPIWNGTPPEGRCVDAMAAGVRMVEGIAVRTVFHGTMTIEDIYGEV